MRIGCYKPSPWYNIRKSSNNNINPFPFTVSHPRASRDNDNQRMSSSSAPKHIFCQHNTYTSSHGHPRRVLQLSQQIISIRLSSTLCHPRASRDIYIFQLSSSSAPKHIFLMFNKYPHGHHWTKPAAKWGDMIVLSAVNIGFDSPDYQTPSKPLHSLGL